MNFRVPSPAEGDRNRVRNFLVRTLYPYGGRRRVFVGPARGLKYVVEPGIGVTYALGWERQLLRRFAAQIRPGQTVYDLGANRGQMTLAFARCVGRGGRVVSFEPVPELFGSLERNVELNRLDQVRCVRAAAGERAGTAAFRYSADLCTLGHLAEVPGPAEGDVFDVPVLTLDGLVESGERPPDFVKVDVQGAAEAVLRGARRLIEGRRAAFYVEQHGPNEQRAVRDELLARGYVAETLEGRRVDDVVGEWQNGLWCRPA